MSILKNIKQQERKDLNRIFTVTMAMVIILDCDEYLYPFFQSIHLPLPSTILTFIWLPLFLLLVFYRLEENKKTVFTAAVVLGVVYLAYFALHHLNCKDLVKTLFLPGNYYYSLYQEFSYYVRMILPLLYIYVIYKLDLSTEDVEKLVVMISAMIAVPILVTNLFTCSPSTYDGWTKANFISWFFNIYDTYTPREIATSFFFSEGNTTGMVLFMTYPILLNITRKRNMDWRLIVLLIVQGLAMYCLATRVATYGVILMTVAYLAIYFFCLFLKKVEWNKKMVFIYLGIIAIFAAIFPVSPAYVNQGINQMNDWYIIENEQMRKDRAAELEDPELEPYSEEYINYWSYIFEDNAFFLSIPPVYFTEKYYYRFDPKFWVDIIFEYDFYDRASGRDIENIFFKYKWKNLSAKQKLLGMSYSIPMEGGIVVEQDFVSQYYTHGPTGWVLLCAPWLLALLVVVVLALKKFKKVIGPDILVFGMSLVAGLAAGYNSGHLLCEVFGSLLLATLLGRLLRYVTD